MWWFTVISYKTFCLLAGMCTFQPCSHSFTHLMTRTNGYDSLVLVVGGSNQHLTVSIPPRPVLSEGEQVLHATTRLLELISSSSVYFTVYFFPPPRMNQECRVGSHGQTKSDCTVLHLWKRVSWCLQRVSDQNHWFQVHCLIFGATSSNPFWMPKFYESATLHVRTSGLEQGWTFTVSSCLRMFAGVLSTSGDFPPFKLCTSLETSLCKAGRPQDSLVRIQLLWRKLVSVLTWRLYWSLHHSVHRFRNSLLSLRTLLLL